MTSAYLAFFEPEALYAAGDWPGASVGDLRGFWHERFRLNASDDLVRWLYPFLPDLRTV